MASLDKNGQDPGFRWTQQRLRAASLVAEDDLSDVEIAADLGIARSTLSNWKAHPVFAAQVGGYVGQLQAAMLRYPIAKKRRRMATLNDLHTKLLTVVEERAEDLEDEAPGGGTGMLVRQVKQIGAGKNATTITEYAVDVAVSREIRALEEQAAKELGQWSEKGELEFSGGIRREYVIVREQDAAPVGASAIVDVEPD